ncbi:MAG: DUF6600 domain-containing protein [Verrucomicrobiales bacterium]
MAISILLIFAGKIIGEDKTTTPPGKIIGQQGPAQPESGAGPGQEAFDLQQDIILRFSQRIAELEAAAAENVAPQVHGSTKPALPLSTETAAPAALPLEETQPDLPSSALLDSSVDIPLADFTPDPDARNDFGEALNPYGEWFTTEPYGEIWQPSIASSNATWAPYTNGGWHSTDAGWHFTSSDPWGWACYHYGRWIRYHDIGWCWVPGRQWAPAWVSWRISDSHIGWCPLPPSATWSPRTGIGNWIDARCNLGPTHYNFVSVSNFGSRNCKPLIFDRRTNFSLMLSTNNITLITGVQRATGIDICNHGPDRDLLAFHQGRRIPRLTIKPEAGRRGALDQIDTGTQQLIAHRRQPSGKKTAALPGLRSLKNKAMDDGWNSINDKIKEKQLRNHLLAGVKSRNIRKLPPLPDNGRMPHKVATGSQKPVNSPVSHRTIGKITHPKGVSAKHGNQPVQPIKATQPTATRLKPRITPTPQVNKNNNPNPAGDRKHQSLEDARRSAFARQQQQQQLIRKKADEAKQAKSLEDARRSAFARQQQQQQLIRKKADEARKSKSLENSRKVKISRNPKSGAGSNYKATSRTKIRQ